MLLWFAHPKKSSPKYNVSVSRDFGWDAVGQYQYEGVRQISIDENWSAIRFKHISQIKVLTRNESNAVSIDGKTRAKNNRK